MDPNVQQPRPSTGAINVNRPNLPPKPVVFGATQQDANPIKRSVPVSKKPDLPRISPVESPQRSPRGLSTSPHSQGSPASQRSLGFGAFMDENPELVQARHEMDEIAREIEKIEDRMSKRGTLMLETVQSLDSLKKEKEIQDWKEKTEVESLTKRGLSERQKSVKTLIQQGIAEEEERRKKQQKEEEIKHQLELQSREDEEDKKRLEQLKLTQKTKSGVISRLLSKFLLNRPSKHELEEKNILQATATTPRGQSPTNSFISTSPGPEVKFDSFIKTHVVDFELPSIVTSTSHGSNDENNNHIRLTKSDYVRNDDNERKSNRTLLRKISNVLKKKDSTAVTPAPAPFPTGPPIRPRSLSQPVRMSRIPCPQFNVVIEKLAELHVSASGQLEIPVVECCIKYIATNWIENEGLFRATGNIAEIRNLANAFQEGSYELPPNSPNEVAGLLKYFLHHLPSPLCTFELHDQFVQIGQLTDETSQSQQLEALVRSMPVPNYILSRRLFYFLHEVCQHSEKNKMNYRNMGLIFGPVFLRAPVAQATMSAISSYHKIAELLVTYPDRFFATEMKLGDDFDPNILFEYPKEEATPQPQGVLTPPPSSLRFARPKSNYVAAIKKPPTATGNLTFSHEAPPVHHVSGSSHPNNANQNGPPLLATLKSTTAANRPPFPHRPPSDEPPTAPDTEPVKRPARFARPVSTYAAPNKQEVLPPQKPRALSPFLGRSPTKVVETSLESLAASIPKPQHAPPPRPKQLAQSHVHLNETGGLRSKPVPPPLSKKPALRLPPPALSTTEKAANQNWTGSLNSRSRTSPLPISKDFFVDPEKRGTPQGPTATSSHVPPRPSRPLPLPEEHRH